MNEFRGWLSLAIVLTVVALFAWCIGASFTGDGFSDYEDNIAIWITGVLGCEAAIAHLVTDEPKKRRRR